MIELSVHLLSGIRIVRDGQDRRLTSRRQRAVVAALALRPGRSVSTEQLVDALWDDDPPDGARATLQTYVSRLRRLLGDDALVHGPGGYRLSDGATCDIDLARELATEARAALTTAPTSAADAARRALELWDGRALAELADDPWFQPAAIGLEELRTNLVDIAAEASISAARPDRAVELLESATRSDPLREPSHVLLIDALCASGRSVEAVRVADRYRRRLRDETGLEPGAALAAAEQRALLVDREPDDPRTLSSPVADSPVADSPVRPLGSTLPRAGRLVGRATELDVVAAALESSRLVTISGPGGVGKTRLAAEMVTQLPAVPVIVVDLAPAGRGEVAATVASALQLRGDVASVPTIAEQLRGVDGVLVVDNAEHVVDEVRDLARTVLDHCPRMRILLTSRTRVDLPDEHALVLAPLATDGDQPAAIELFIDVLGRSGRGPRIDGADRDVRRICARLDGLPLALELAAGRAAVLGLGGLRDRLDTALDLIAAGVEGDRHASLRSVVTWSYDLLDPASRRLLTALAVFEGEFDLDAAERVGAAVLGQPVSLLLGRLVDASLVATTGVAGRYRLLEMIRQFGRERLEADDHVDVVREVHARWVSERLATIEADSVGPGEADTSRRIDAIRGEVRSALRWARSRDDADLAAAVLVPLAGPLLYRPDAELIGAARAVVDRFVDHPGASAAAPAGLTAAGARLAFLAGDLERVDRLVESTLAHDDADAAGRHRARHARGVVRLYQGRHDEAARSFAAVSDDAGASIVDRLDALGGLGLALCYGGRATEARPVVEQHLAIAATLDSDGYRAFAAYMQGEIDVAAGDLDAATGHLRDAAEWAWEVGAAFIWGIAATVLAAVLVRHRSPVEARAHLPVLLERWRRTATWTQLWATLRLLAELLAAHDRDDVAALILLSADRDPAAPELTGEDLDRDAALRGRLRDRLGATTYTGIDAGVAALERVDVLDRAVGALEQLDLA